MKHLYTLEEIHRYADEVRRTDKDLWEAINHHDTDQKNQIQAQLHVMHEVLTRMHESLEKYGAYRPGLLGRWLAAREIRKLGKQFKPSTLQADLLAAAPKLNAVTDHAGRTTLTKAKE